MTRWPVLAQLNAASPVDEATEAVLDILQDQAAATDLHFAVHGYNPAVMDRGRTWAGCSRNRPPAPSAAPGSVRPESRPRRWPASTAWPRSTAMPLARDRSVDLHILESAGTGGRQRDVAQWPQVLEIDGEGRRAAGVLPPIAGDERRGLPADYLRQGVETVRRLSGGSVRIRAGIGIDVFEQGLDAPMAAAEAGAAMRAAHEAGADGIIVSRNHAAMRHETLSAVGDAVRSLRP